MDTWEFNKFAGASLAALLIAFGSGAIIDIVAPTHAALKPGYQLPFKPEAGGETGPKQEEFSFAKVAELMQKASPENGQAVFKRCATCHTTEKGGRVITGPNQWGVVGRNIASEPNFPRYSAALKSHQGEKWTWDKLAAYIHDPRGTIPGNQMAFAGIKNTDELADLLVYLRTLNDNPPPLPEPPAQQPQGEAQQQPQAQPATKKQ